MLARCNNPKQQSYARYGGRGIRVCARWHLFENFYADMGPRPSPSHSIDRFPNNNGDYEPDNCRWATNEQQSNNRRSSRMVAYRGETMTLAEAVQRGCQRYDSVLARLKDGWDVDAAIDTPIRKKQPKRLDQLEADYQADLNVIRQCMERTS